MKTACCSAEVLLLVAACGSALAPVEGARVLALFPLNARSHFAMFERLLCALAERGHSVDVVSHFPLKDPPQGYRDLSIAGSLPSLLNNFTVDVALSLGVVRNSLNFFWETNLHFCEEVAKHPVLQRLLRSNTSYDLLLTELFGVDCMLGFAPRAAASVQLISSVMLPWGNDRLGNPDSPAVVPVYFLPLASPMPFAHRALNAMALLAFKMGNLLRGELPTDRFLRRHFGADSPSLWSLQRNVSLVLVNSHFSLHDARAAVPSFVEVGGMHIPPPQPLPQELRRWLDGAGAAGAVYFSFGSLVRVESLDAPRLASVVQALGALPQRVLWKADPRALPPLPSNVLARAWMPQADVLAHRHVVAFVTHGGLMGSMEALAHGVPMVVVPFFGDQPFNARNYVRRGVAVELDAKTFSGNELHAALHAVTTDPRFRANARALSSLFMDRPQPPLDAAIFWTEYVIRHKGAPHLRSAAVHIPWWQYLLLDVAAAAAVALGAVLFLLRMITKWWCCNARCRKVDGATSGEPKLKTT